MTQSNRLTDADSLIRRIEGDPVLRTPILVVALLDRTPKWSDARAAVDEATKAIPRLRQRLETSGPTGRLMWVEDHGFSLDHHLRRVRVPDDGGIDSVLHLAQPDAVADFDAARPMWQLTVVEGLEGGRAALILRFHHTITDGVGAVELADRLFTSSRRDVRHRRTDKGGVVEQTAAVVPNGSGPGLRPLFDAALDPVHTVRTGVRTARSVAKMLSPAREPLSPILRGRGLDRQLNVLEAPFDDLRATAHAAGGTVNDVLLATVAGGLRRYHQAFDRPVPAVRVTMPINLRTSGDDAGGNHFTPTRFVLPIDDPDPIARARLAGAIVRRWRGEPAVGLSPLLATALSRLPDSLVQRAFAGMLRSVDVNVVDVPGLRRPAFMAGARVERLWAFAPSSGAALSITLVSHLDAACLAIASDPTAVDDPALMVRCMEMSLQETLEAGRSNRSEARP